MENIQYLKVHERLSLAKRILEQSEQLCDSSLIQRIENGGWTHPYIQHDALVNYLLLTCFDSLGQSPEWLPFNSWLEAERTKSEREEAAARISHSASPIVIAKEMYAAYQEIYGVKTSFYRFIDEILDEKTRERLLLSVQIEQKTEDGKSVVIDDPLKKKSFLYESRNLFTHQSIPTGSAARGVGLDILIVEGNNLLWGYTHVRTNRSYCYWVRRWPFELFEIISSVIDQPIEIYDFDLECRVWVDLESGRQVVLENIRFSSLRDLSKINNAAMNILSST